MSVAGPAMVARPLALLRSEEATPRRRRRIEELEQQIERLLPNCGSR